MTSVSLSASPPLSPPPSPFSFLAPLVKFPGDKGGGGGGGERVDGDGPLPPLLSLVEEQNMDREESAAVMSFSQRGREGGSIQATLLLPSPATRRRTTVPKFDLESGLNASTRHSKAEGF